MRLPDWLTGAAVAALGASVVLYARGLPAEFGRAGPGLFPTVIGTVMVLAGLAVTVRGLRPGRSSQAANAWLRQPRALLALAVVPAGLGAYALALPSVGASVAGAALVAVAAVAWRRRVPEALALGIGAAIVMHLVFAVMLRVPLPAGPLEALLP